MKLESVTALALAGTLGAAAPQAPWQQCGGKDWKESTTCVDGWYCAYQNEWYSQCLQGSGPGASTTVQPTSSTIRAESSSTKLTSASSSRTSAQVPSSTAVTCPNAFVSVSAKDYIKAMNPGWNLGNTLDAVPNEGSWNNPPVVAATFDDAKAAGFKSVRIPVTYTHHYITGSPSWTIDPAWLQRVSDVVDMATSKGLYVLTNMHHDSWGWADVSKADANITMIQEKFYASWVQIATKLACKPSSVSLEPINEPPGNTAADGERINQFNDIFLRALGVAGGHSTRRVVTLVGAATDPTKTTQWFRRPANVVNPWALQFHYYSPYDFIFSAWGKTTWGSAADEAALAQDLNIVRGNFSDVPLVIGEFDASAAQIEPAARRRYYNFLVQHATSKLGNTAVMLWDMGLNQLDRNRHTWRDQTIVDMIMAATAGRKNAVAEATTDASALTQSSSTVVFQKVGEAVVDRTLNFLLNGNTLSSVSLVGGQALRQGSDYVVSGGSVVLKAAFLSRYVSATAAPGSKANLTVSFTGGSAPYGVEIIQWNVPRFSATTSKATGAEVSIPIDFNGLRLVAAVNIRRSDGTYAFDDWTQYLPALQQGRGTHGSHWNFDLTNVFITAAASQAVVTSGKTTTFTFEFFPRVPGNSVNYTLTV